MKIKCAYGIVTPNLNIENIKKTEPFNKVQRFQLESSYFVSLSKVDTEPFFYKIIRDFDEIFEGSYDKLKQFARVNFGDEEVRLVAIKGRNYITIQIGRGIIADYHEKCDILSNSDEVQINVQKGEALEGQGFLLISPAASKSLYPKGSTSLSPACATFFQWLNEYDEEAVSEAIVDNIEKYFIKDDKEDVSVAFVLIEELNDIIELSEENETIEAHEEPILEEETLEEPLITLEQILEPIEFQNEQTEAKHKSENDEVKTQEEQRLEKPKAIKEIKYFKPLIAASILIIIAVSVALTINDPNVFQNVARKEIKELSFIKKSEGKPLQSKDIEVIKNTDQDIQTNDDNSDDSNYEPTISFAVKSPESLEPGEYKIGIDIPAGEYFFWTGEMLEPGKIVLNDDSCLSRPLYCMTVIVDDYDVLWSEYRFTRAENVNPIEAAKGILISGKYKIGKDIKPGEYKVSPLNKDVEGRCYIVHNSEISDDTYFNEETLIQVPDDGYLVLYDGFLEMKN